MSKLNGVKIAIDVLNAYIPKACLKDENPPKLEKLRSLGLRLVNWTYENIGSRFRTSFLESQGCMFCGQPTTMIKKKYKIEYPICDRCGKHDFVEPQDIALFYSNYARYLELLLFLGADISHADPETEEEIAAYN